MSASPSIILDENFSDTLAVALRNLGYDAVSIHETEWTGFKNGALATELANSKFDVIVTKDRNFANQSGILKKKPNIIVIVVDSFKLKQVKNSIFNRRFVRALESEGLPEQKGIIHVWPKSYYNEF